MTSCQTEARPATVTVAPPPATITLDKENCAKLLSTKKPVTYITVSEGAKEKIISLMDNKKNDQDVLGIKISLVSKGCSGLSYKVEYVIAGMNFNSAYEWYEISPEIALFIDPKTSIFIFGTTLDYEETKFASGFKFTNPNEKGRCGCGESFYV